MPVLRNLDLEVNPAEHVVLTGPSGVGKTTVAALVQGNRRPDSGTVSIGGHDLRGVPVAWVRAQMGVVAQDTYLFTGTLRDNLLIADPRADDDRLIDALRRAHLGELMDRLPAGLDTAVGERGMALSGGEAQRVAIARALLKDAPILLLDEPTAHVDLTSEREILQALRTAAKGRTTLTISHRQATIEDAQKRLELRDGHTVALVEGTGA
ncbi:MAG: ATP-binding cassette domain-containing protein [Propionibacterium sp.]|nr:ATP-binding cassette domain-containing protein [Propionibacterium sp.]